MAGETRSSGPAAERSTEDQGVDIVPDVDDVRRDRFRDVVYPPAPRHVVGGLAFVGMAVLPAALTPVQLGAVIGVVYLMVFAMSWDIISGYTGQISLGHSMFFAMGGYTTAVLNLQHGVGPLVSIPIAVALATLLALVVGVPALRLRGPYLSLVTLIVPLIMVQLTILFSDGLPVLAPDGLKGTGGFLIGPAPLVGTEPRALVTVGRFRSAIIADYYVAFAVLVVIFGLLFLVTRSHVGDVFTAIREDEAAVAAVGLNPAKFKLYAFALSGATGGVAGAMFVHSTAGHPLPELLLELRVSLQVIVMAVLGGMGTITGAMVGAVFVVVVNQAINEIPYTIPVVERSPSVVEPIPVFVLGIAVLRVLPAGILPGLVSLGRRLVSDEEDAESAGSSALSQVVAKYRDALQPGRRRE